MVCGLLVRLQDLKASIKEKDMIIDTNGKELSIWYRKNGVLIFDADNKYGIKFAIGVEYSDKQKELFLRKKELKKY